MKKTKFSFPTISHKWEVINESNMSENDSFIATMPVRVISKWNDNIPEDFDERGVAISWRKGFEFHVLANQVNSNPDQVQEKCYLASYKQEPKEEQDIDIFLLDGRANLNLEIGVSSRTSKKIDYILQQAKKNTSSKNLFMPNASSEMNRDRHKLCSDNQVLNEQLEKCVSEFTGKLLAILSQHAQ